MIPVIIISVGSSLALSVLNPPSIGLLVKETFSDIFLELTISTSNLPIFWVNGCLKIIAAAFVKKLIVRLIQYKIAYFPLVMLV